MSTITKLADHMARMAKLEESLRKMPEGLAPVDHVFADGVYARCMNIPKGTMLTGKIHKTQHLNIVAKGRILVATEDGTKEISAPCIFVSEPGTKRAGYALEDTVWINIHVTDETDLDKIEEQVIDNSKLISEVK
jgi:quercetin dioxygenase-like cupin family protein